MPQRRAVQPIALAAEASLVGAGHGPRANALALGVPRKHVMQPAR